VGLSGHIADVEAVFHFERLDDVVLCGQSYGGMVATGVADRVADAVRLVAYLDAFVPRDGQAVADLVSPEFRDLIRQTEQRGESRVPYPKALWPPEGSLPEPARESYIGRMLPHPVRTMTEPISLSGAVERLPRAFVRCTGGEHGEPEPEMERFAQRARAEGWAYRESATPHDLQLYDPIGTAEILHGLLTARR
jgi:pimeloyl-ACP methyl ester carboxylesterase